MSISASSGTKGEASLAKDANSTTGTGGDTMSVWKNGRETLLNELINASFTNKSSFSIPAAIVEGTAANQWENSEAFQGNGVTATVLDSDGNPMTGTAQLTIEDVVVREETQTGQIKLNTPPQPSITAGQNGEYTEMSFYFTPSTKAISLFEQSLGGYSPLGLIEYGSVSGTVTDYNGDPVKEEAVIGPGLSTVTDENGEYEMEAPGGNQFPLVSLSQSVSQDVQPPSGGTAVQDFQYGKVTVSVIDKDYSPIEGAKVNVNGNIYTTDKTGTVDIPTAPIQRYGILVQDYWSAEFEITEMGGLIEATMGPESGAFTNPNGDPANLLDTAGVKLKVVDQFSGRKVRGVEAVDAVNGLRNESGEDGVVKILTEKADGDLELVLGPDDARYRTRTLTVSPPADTMAEAEVPLKRETETVNF